MNDTSATGTTQSSATRGKVSSAAVARGTAVGAVGADAATAALAQPAKLAATGGGVAATGGRGAVVGTADVGAVPAGAAEVPAARARRGAPHHLRAGDPAGRFVDRIGVGRSRRRGRRIGT